MDENNTNRRNDATIKAIFSRISNDDELVKEVRQLLAENLQLRSSSGNNVSGNNNDAAVANNDNYGDVSAEASLSSSSQSDVVVNNGKQKLSMSSSGSTSSQQCQRQHDPLHQQEKEELAFTIDKDSETYSNILSMAKWYRDYFFISTTYANDKQELRTREMEEAASRRKALEEQQKKHRHVGNTPTLRRYRPQIGNRIPPSSGTDINPPLSSPLAIGHPLLLSIGENYIRSTYAVDLLRPYATWAVSKNGPLLHTASQSLAQTIPLGQASCDWAARDNLLWVLQDQEWREWAKSITTRYINVDDARNGSDHGDDDDL